MQTNTKSLNPFSTFENHLKEIRARRRITQLRLSIETQIPQTRISYFENGFYRPNENEKRKIAEILEVEVTDIFPSD
jgi:DNA-binding XRE family transcriptional regulator